MILVSTSQILEQLQKVIVQLSNQELSKKLFILNNSSVGAHTRHILEFYLCLLESTNQVVNYDLRKRDKTLETEVQACIKVITQIQQKLNTVAKDYKLQLEGSYCKTNNDASFRVSSTFYRELLYNIEHTVHHMALIKIGLKELNPQLTVEDDFGVAASTQRFEKACAQ